MNHVPRQRIVFLDRATLAPQTRLRGSGSSSAVRKPQVVMPPWPSATVTHG